MNDEDIEEVMMELNFQKKIFNENIVRTNFIAY